MKVNRPLRRTPGKKVLEKNRRGDQQPVWPHERHPQKRKEQRPKQVSMREGLKERSQYALWSRDRFEQNVLRGCAQAIVQSEVINIPRVECWDNKLCTDEKPQDRQNH